MRARTLLPALLLISSLLAMPGRAWAQDGLEELPTDEDAQGSDEDVAGSEEDAADGEEAAASTDESTEAYLKALALQRKGKFQGAQRAFWKVLKKFPDSVHKQDILLRSGWEGTENHYAGTVILHESGPPARRIDVAVMGDGFTVAKNDQKKELDWAKLCVDVLISEASFREYLDYFNYYYVRLVSEDEKVDPKLTDAQKARIDEKNKRRSKKRKYDYETALDCKAAGPGGQVMADRRKVFHWLNVARRDVAGVGDDALVIAFARFGKLGMGGGGVANVGRPDKSVTVHEFGHAFTGLLDEYTNNPTKPRRAIRAPNATSDPEDIPWQHFLDAKKKGVEVIEGGATFVKGVWRPAKTCAMNAAGATGFCPVCREANVLAIYRYVSPIDTSSPGTTTELKILEGDDTVIAVTPMQPRKHDLDVTWHVETMSIDADGPEVMESGGTGDIWLGPRGGAGSVGGRGRWSRGRRAYEDRSAFDEAPIGDLSKLAKKPKRKKGKPRRHEFPVGQLPVGRYKVTVVVKDTTDWVLKDANHLLEERETWWVTVAPQP